MRKMRHKNWKTYLKIACSWLLIFSICFMNLETVSASEDETSVVTEQEETQDTEAFTSETDAQQTETEQTSEQFTSETETETSAETEEQIPDSIEVEKLEKEIQEATSNGQVPTTKLVEYVDESGNAIEGAPETIELGKISDHSELNISDKDYEFKSAKVNDADCSFIGVYKDTVYWSSDNINANKFADGQKLTMTYALKEKEKESEISKTEDLEQEKDTTETKESETEISEKSSEQIIDNEKSTEQASDEQLPDTISVQSLNIAMQRSVTNGNEQTTNRVEYVDAKGTLINGAPTTIAYGNISEHKALLIDGKHFDFLSAKVNGKDCVYIGEYNGVLYYSTDGVVAIKMEAEQKLTMTYQEYYFVMIKEVLPTNCDPGIIAMKKGSEDVPVETNKQIRVNAGEDWVISVTPGKDNHKPANYADKKERFKIESVKTEKDAGITQTSGDEYGATYKIGINQDDTVIISYTNQGVYRVTINTKDNAGVEYINISHSIKNGWTYLEGQDKIEWTFKESDFSSGDSYLYMPEFHVNRGYRLVHMTVNGYTMDSSANGYYREVPTSTGTSDELTSSPGNVTIITQMTNEYKSSRGDEANCSYAYAMRLKVRGGAVEDYNFNLAPYSIKKQALTVRLYTNQRRNSEGLDVVMWDYEKQKLVPVKDNDVIDMNVVKYDGKDRRQVRIFFVKPKSGYVLTNGLSSSTGVSYGLPHGDETGLSNGHKSSVNAGKIDTMTETSIISGNNEFYIYTNEWKAAKDAAKKAGYTTYLAWGAADPINTNWFLYAASFEAASSNLYVHYNSGAGEGVLPEDALVNNIPYNQETNNQNKPMQSYGENPSTYKGARGMGTTFVMGESYPEPTCEGYEFVGWKLKDRSGKLSDTLYKHGDLFTIAEDNYAYANNTDLPLCSWNNESGYQIVAQWKKIDTKKVEVKHWLKVPNSTVKLEKTTAGTISFATENESVKVFAKPEPDGTFPGYIFDKDDPHNTLEKTVTNDASTDTIELNLYYKPTVLTVRKIVSGYNLELDKAFSFTIQANAPDGKDTNAATLSSDQVYIKKGDGTEENLAFTNNQATFTLKKDEYVDISCLPTGWTYTVTETEPGTNFKASYSINGGTVTDGAEALFTMATTGSEAIQFTNTSTIAPPVTGRDIQNSSWIMMLIVALLIGMSGVVFFRKVKRKYR